jgi:hypothetical protein
MSRGGGSSSARGRRGTTDEEDDDAGNNFLLAAHKLEFPKFDGTGDPHPWLNRCGRYFLGMAVRVRVTRGFCTRRVRVRVHFCTRDPNLTRAEPGLGAGFIFHPRVHLKPENPPKIERNLKPEKIRNLEETRKKPKKP